MNRPGIDVLAGPTGTGDLVLLAHGGQVQSLADAHAWRAAILRMWPFAAVARDAVPGTAVGLMRYRYRGWNGVAAHPAADLRTVLDGLPGRIQRVVLIGHSMGGRAVMAAGNHPLVVGVLALAPWLPQDEPLTMHGSPAGVAEAVGASGPPPTVVLAHGTDDRITDPRLTAAYARRLRTTGLPVGLLSVEGETHPMLRRYADWNELVRRFTIHTLGQPDRQREGGCEVLSTEPDRVDLLPRWNRTGSTSAAVRAIALARLRLRVGDPL
jgi:pimeloyl-ACP methyl ester carboxylesterase